MRSTKPLVCAECGGPVVYEESSIVHYQLRTHDIGASMDEVFLRREYETIDSQGSVLCMDYPHHRCGYREDEWIIVETKEE